ncbi:hypothetical protein [Pantoea sp. CTOTU46764]|uniref:hypothetical protein n=1 Tax=Pantoea sp. CTOTU46764 TaxID=2953854 RepID=UPI00289A1D7D|nr:hypothetical protein [Pantoea sp. CTOTU46764]
MRKKQILQVVEGRVLPDDKHNRAPEIKVSRKHHRKMRQQEWDDGTLDRDSLQHFKSL